MDRNRAEEQEQEQQAKSFNPREHAGRLIQIPPHYQLICKIRLHVASAYTGVKENNLIKIRRICRLSVCL